MMNRNHYEGRHSGEDRRPARRRSHINVRLAAIVLATVTLLALAVGGTIAWIKADTTPVQNTFTYANVTTTVEEELDGNVKKDVKAGNTGDIDAFIRIKLVPYRTNAEGQRIGGDATLDSFTIGADWKYYNGFYYYTKPVAPGDYTGFLTRDEIVLKTYTDADGGYQSLDVMAEAIQSTPEAAVKDAWGDVFSIDANGNLVVPQN